MCSLSCVSYVFALSTQLKQNILEVMTLEKAFTRLREGRNKGEGTSSPHPAKSKGGKFIGPITEKVLTSKLQKGEARETGEKEERDEHMVYASDLVLTLGVTEEEAEEMIFIADLQDNQAIDFTEFKQVVVNWS